MKIKSPRVFWNIPGSNHLPIQEDPSKFIVYKGDKTREVKPQSRGERGLRRRYVDDDEFIKLNRAAISLELEAEAVKQDF